MIQSIYIKNFKAWDKQTFQLMGEHAVFVGENDSGKSSILQALDYFFNLEKIESEFVRDPSEDVEIGIRLNGTFFKRAFTGKSHKKCNADDSQDWSAVDAIHYIYLPPSSKSPEIVLKELAKARFDERITQDTVGLVEQIASDSIDSILDSISNDFVIVNGDKTKLNAAPKITLSKAVDFTISSNGIPLAGRGSGYQKNITYAMLIGKSYSNVVLGIDEIENSFSAINTGSLISELQCHIRQILMTTHSGSVIERKGKAQVIPVGETPGKSVAEVLKALEGEGKKYLLVEGKYDLPWFRTALSLLGRSGDINVIPAGGSNLDLLLKELSEIGMDCLAIVDGDTKANESAGKFALNRECIELYTPKELLINLFGCPLKTETKRAFFEDALEIKKGQNDDSIKNCIAEKISECLGSDSAFVVEIEALLTKARF